MKSGLAEEDLFFLRTLTCFCAYLVESISDLKWKVVCILNIFYNIFGKTSKERLLQFSSPIDFEMFSSETLVELFEQLSRRKVGIAKAE